MNFTELIDVGGHLDTELKQKKKDLDKIKKALREHMKEDMIAEDYGEAFILKAASHVTTTPDLSAVINAYISVKKDQIDPEEEITISGRDLMLFLDAVSVSVSNIRRDFTEESAGLLMSSVTKEFHTLTFKKVDP